MNQETFDKIVTQATTVEQKHQEFVEANKALRDLIPWSSLSNDDVVRLYDALPDGSYARFRLRTIAESRNLKL